MRFPSDSDSPLSSCGLRVQDLARQIGARLLAGRTHPAPQELLAPVAELIRLLPLDLAFAEHLPAEVRPDYHQIWNRIHSHSKDGSP